MDNTTGSETFVSTKLSDVAIWNAIKADIVVNVHSACARPEFRQHRYAVFHSGPSATAGIEGVLILGQGVRSLSVLLVPGNSGELDQAQVGHRAWPLS